VASLEAYQRLNAPVDRIFQQLKDRLDTLPTRAQRKAAVEAGRVEEEQAKGDGRGRRGCHRGMRKPAYPELRTVNPKAGCPGLFPLQRSTSNVYRSCVK